MKRKNLGLAFLLILPICTACSKKETSVSISYQGNEKTVLFAVDEIKSALQRNNLHYVDGKGDYEVILTMSPNDMDKESYTLDSEGNTITITGADRNGLMYGGLQLAEEINLNRGINGIKDYQESPYTEFRGISVRPPMDLRTPSYTNNGDSTRWNMENTWDLDYWKGLFDIMARMRYNLLSFATVNSIASMVSVPGYEDCALEDVYEYTGDYDDTYLGNCTNMFREEQLKEGNYRVLKKMTIAEKTQFWKDVMSAANDRGIQWQFSTMNLYTFAENGKHGITDSRDNETTKDYFRKAYETILETFPYITQLKTTCGENMDYPAEEEHTTDMWYRDVYGKAVENVLDRDPERAKTFELGFAGVGNTQLSNDFYSCFQDYKYNLFVNKRYNDTRLFSVTDCTDNDEYIKNMPEGWEMIYNVRAEDCYHYTWGDPSFARDFCKNIIQNHVRGWHFAIDGYYVSGKEYEFRDDSLNGDYYYNRHWLMYSMFGRFAYNPEITDERWKTLFLDHYRDVPTETAEKAYQAIVTASKIMPEIICQYSPGGTDAAFLPEMCCSNPTLFGFLDIKRFINNDTADPDGDIYSFAEYAKLFASGEKKLTKRTPFQVADSIRNYASQTSELSEEVLSLIGDSNISLKQTMLDQKGISILGNYYADKFSGAMNLRLYNDTQDKSYQNKSVAELTDGLSVWKEYASLYLSRFKKERLPRHGYIDPDNFTSVVEKDIKTAANWTKRTY